MEEKKEKKNNWILTYLIKWIVAFVLVIILAYIVMYGLLGKFLSDYAYEQRDIENKELYYINDSSRIRTMVAHGENGMSATPIDAYIKNGMIYVKAKLKNNTGMNLKLRDFGIVTANATSVPFSTNYEDNTVINNNNELEVVFEFGAYDVMYSSKDYPTSIFVELETYQNDNYYKYDLTFTIGWRYNNYYN